MADKCKCPPEGAPDWVMTFGDLMSLLLTFFILLLSLSEIKREDEFRAIVREVKKAFGMQGGGGKVPSKDDPELTYIERIKALQLISQKQPQKSNSSDPGITGPQTTVESVRLANYQATGGRITFEPGSAELTEEDRRLLVQVAGLLRGHTTIIHVAGHADTGELADQTRYASLRDLSYERARAVEQYLIGDACRLDPERIEISAHAEFAPLKHDVYEPPNRRTNRRVEVLSSDMLVSELQQPEIDRSP